MSVLGVSWIYKELFCGVIKFSWFFTLKSFLFFVSVGKSICIEIGLRRIECDGTNLSIKQSVFINFLWLKHRRFPRGSRGMYRDA